jgi:trk system potassium uptake protein TrkH
VLSVAVLPLLGSGGVQLARAEAPGPEPDRLTPRFRETAKRLWLVYVALTGIVVVLLAVGDMNLFEAVAHGLTTVSTGGFSTEADSIGAFGAYTQWVVIAFMFVSGVSFALHFRALRNPSVYARSGEFRLYTFFVVTASLLIVGGLWVDGLDVGRQLRHAVFTAVTLVTGTGYTTTDYSAWTEGLQILAVGLMFLGGMAGSTAGGIKTFRVGVLTKASAQRLKQLVYPNAVLLTRWDRRPVSDPVLRSIQSFFLFYIMVFLGGTFLLAVLESIGGSGTNLVTATSAVASALGNVGPGLGSVGPGGGYVAISAGGKWLLSFIMILGRLEIFPVLLLFTRYLWKR